MPYERGRAFLAFRLSFPPRRRGAPSTAPTSVVGCPCSQGSGGHRLSFRASALIPYRPAGSSRGRQAWGARAAVRRGSEAWPTSEMGVAGALRPLSSWSGFNPLFDLGSHSWFPRVCLGRPIDEHFDAGSHRDIGTKRRSLAQAPLEC